MDGLAVYGMTASRILISMVFILNALGIIDQTIPAKEMIERGAPARLVPLLMFAGRSVELVAGIGLASGILSRLSALALFAFIVPATFVSHSFWLDAGTPRFMSQLINFSKNVAIWGGLLFLGSNPGQPSLFNFDHMPQHSVPALVSPRHH